MAARDLTATEAAARLERRGGLLLVHARVRETGAFFPSNAQATYRCLGREDGATVISGPGGKRWLLRTDADRAAVADDMARVKDELNAHAARPGIVFVFGHRNELQSDAGYGQVGCVLALVSTAIGWVLGLVGASILTGDVSGGHALAGPIVGFLVAMFTGDAVGSALARIPALRDRVADLAMLYELLVPGLVTFLVIVVGSTGRA